jgi:hypothetical protein
VPVKSPGRKHGERRWRRPRSPRQSDPSNGQPASAGRQGRLPVSLRRRGTGGTGSPRRRRSGSRGSRRNRAGAAPSQSAAGSPAAKRFWKHRKSKKSKLAAAVAVGVAAHVNNRRRSDTGIWCRRIIDKPRQAGEVGENAGGDGGVVASVDARGAGRKPEVAAEVIHPQRIGADVADTGPAAADVAVRRVGGASRESPDLGPAVAVEDRVLDDESGLAMRCHGARIGIECAVHQPGRGPVCDPDSAASASVPCEEAVDQQKIGVVFSANRARVCRAVADEDAIDKLHLDPDARIDRAAMPVRLVVDEPAADESGGAPDPLPQRSAAADAGEAIMHCPIPAELAVLERRAAVRLHRHCAAPCRFIIDKRATEELGMAQVVAHHSAAAGRGARRHVLLELTANESRAAQELIPHGAAARVREDQLRTIADETAVDERRAALQVVHGASAVVERLLGRDIVLEDARAKLRRAVALTQYSAAATHPPALDREPLDDGVRGLAAVEHERPRRIHRARLDVDDRRRGAAGAAQRHRLAAEVDVPVAGAGVAAIGYGQPAAKAFWKQRKSKKSRAPWSRRSRRVGRRGELVLEAEEVEEIEGAGAVAVGVAAVRRGP